MTGNPQRVGPRRPDPAGGTTFAGWSLDDRAKGAIPMPEDPSKATEETGPVKADKPTTGSATGSDAPPAGESEAVNDRGLEKNKKGDDEETMPIEEGFSLVP
jgi:hypothetical protein